MNILFTDLDNTLIYSKKTDIAEKIPVELYNGEVNSFMSKHSYELLHKLNEMLLIVPITTRTYIQYSRIDFGFNPKYVLCANGGILLKDGIKSDEWYAKSEDHVFAAGDTEFDIGMIELADIGFAHKDLNISKNIFNDYEGLFSDFYLEKVLEYIKE